MKTFSTLLYEQFYQKQVRREPDKRITVNILEITPMYMCERKRDTERERNKMKRE